MTTPLTPATALLAAGLALTSLPGAAWAAAEQGAGDAAQSDWDNGWNDSWDEAWEDDAAEQAEPWLTGFLEQTLGSRLSDSPHHNDMALQDSRLRLEYAGELAGAGIDAKADLYYDGVIGQWQHQVRELSLKTSIGQLDIKAGRQILTWGTGDYLFLNDLFPKDWQSFFAGRQDEYLKAPSDAIKVSYYGRWANLNLVYSPEFDPDDYISGEYFSFFDRRQQTVAGPGFIAQRPSRGEWAARLYKNLGSNEWAIYGYDGLFKSPNAIDPDTGRYTFSRLQSLGASWRRPLAQGLFNGEIAYYHSVDDHQGDDPLIGNSQWRFLLGYEQELISRLTGAVQFYLERTQHHSSQRDNSPAPQLETERNRVWLTNRLSWRDRQDKLSLGLFVFYSPTDQDAYLRPTASYRFNDHWHTTLGINWFAGDETHTFFGQFEDNNNIYARVRYSF